MAEPEAAGDLSLDEILASIKKTLTGDAGPHPAPPAGIHPLFGARPAAPLKVSPAGSREAAPPPAPPPAPAEGLLSAQADEAISSAFDQLTDAMMAEPPQSLAEIVRQMMRPMLKDWLDDNLPALVERIVREEIARLTRRR